MGGDRDQQDQAPQIVTEDKRDAARAILALAEEGESPVAVDLATPALAADLAALLAEEAPHLSVVRASAAGAFDSAHLCHLIGHALGAPYPADQASLCEHLAGRGRIMVVLEAAASPYTEPALARLSAVAPEARFILLGSGIHAPRLRLLGPHPRAPRATHGVRLLSMFPAGLPGSPPLDVAPALLAPGPPGRATLLPDGRIRSTRPPRGVVPALQQRLHHLLELAEAPHLACMVDPRDLPPLLFLARHHPDPLEGARASAALARQRLKAGHGEIRPLSERPGETPPLGEGWLAWVEGDALLEQGEAREALQAWEVAAARFTEAHRRDLLFRLHWGAAVRLSQRMDRERALKHALEARGLAKDMGPGAGLLELVLWELFEGERGDAETPCGPLPHRLGPDRPLLELALATRSLQAGDLQGAEETLGAMDAPSLDPLLAAARKRRQAEVYTRSGRLTEADRLLVEASWLLAAMGERVAHGMVHRARGDLAALQGMVGQAHGHYEQAARLQARCGDLGGLARTLRHQAAWHLDLGSDTTARHLDSLALDLDAASQSPRSCTEEVVTPRRHRPLAADPEG